MPHHHHCDFDVIVIGGGHAGAEAAWAAANCGARVALVTMDPARIGAMSCNPAIGGLAKGQMVREIDALGGEMALNTDFTAIQFKLLNTSKGPAVQAPRAQCDKKAYQLRMKYLLESASGIDLHQGNAVRLLVSGSVVKGVQTNLDLELSSSAVVLSAGTFMRGLMARNHSARFAPVRQSTSIDSCSRPSMRRNRRAL